jgi:hypothetical protein
MTEKGLCFRDKLRHREERQRRGDLKQSTFFITEGIEIAEGTCVLSEKILRYY